MYEVFVVIVGVWFLFLRFVWEAIKDSKVIKSEKAMDSMEKQMTNREYEIEVTNLVNGNLEHPQKLYDLIDDNMREIYGAGYRNLPELTRGNLTGRNYFDPTSYTQNEWSCTGTTGMIKCLIMSKRGLVPEVFYRRGIKVLYTNPHTPARDKQILMAYAGQVQKNLDEAGVGAKMVWVKTHKRGAHYDLETRWKHDYLLPFINDGISRVKYGG